MADIGFSKVVVLGMTVGSTTGLVSVLIPLELAPGTSVGVLTKIFPLRCRGSHQEDHADFEDSRVCLSRDGNPEQWQ